jgi:hypothetical protein
VLKVVNVLVKIVLQRQKRKVRSRKKEIVDVKSVSAISQHAVERIKTHVNVLIASANDMIVYCISKYQHRNKISLFIVTLT